jgi:hypothetical protein
VGLTFDNPAVPINAVFNHGTIGGNLVTNGYVGSSRSVYPFSPNRLAVFDVGFGGASPTVTLPARAATDPWIIGVRLSMDKPFTTQTMMTFSGSTIVLNSSNHLVWSGLDAGAFALFTTQNLYFGWDGANRFLEVGGVRVSSASAYVAPPTAETCRFA